MRLCLAWLMILAACSQEAADPAPATADPNPANAQAAEQSRTGPAAAELLQQLDQQIEQLTAAIAATPAAEGLYSQRGDACFFRGRFTEALADYDKLAEINPEIVPPHWRRGLALYYVGRYEEAARQFERYFEHDKSDRENGIWRYYAQVRQLGLEEARQRLLPYEQPDREPLPDIYLLCLGEINAAELERRIAGTGMPEPERLKRQFYGHLYLGLDYAIKNDAAAARKHLEQAVASPWPRRAGYGPTYMWHVGRLQLDLLPTEAASDLPEN